MDFTHEARNAARTIDEFTGIRTSLYIPKVVFSQKRILIMEFIEGGRVDDLHYLAKCNIDRNKVAIELSRIFSQMVFINGWFHAVSLIIHELRLLLTHHPARILILVIPTSAYFKGDFNVVQVTSSSDPLVKDLSLHIILKSFYWITASTSTWTRTCG